MSPERVVGLILAVSGGVAALITAIAALITAVAKRKLDAATATPAVTQGVPVDTFADDAVEAWKGRALTAEDRLVKADQRIADLEHRLATIEAQASHK